MLDLPVRYEDLGDAEMAWSEVGEGPPLVFVHGWPLSSATWVKLVPLLSPHFRCVLIDQAGAGATRVRSGANYNFRGQARRLDAFIRARGYVRPHVIAQDTGATVARYAALTEGSPIASLVMFNTEIPGHRPPFVELFQKTMLLPGATAAFKVLLRSALFRKSAMGFGGCFTDRSLIEGDFYDRTVRPLLDSPERLEGVRRYLLGIDREMVDALAEKHRGIEIPTLFIWGEDDPTFPIDRAGVMLDQLPGCRGLRRVAGASLLPYEEKPEASAGHALAFYRSIGALPPT